MVKLPAVHNNMYGFRGVEWDGQRKMFRARIEPEPGKRGRFLGRFASAEQAAQAYDDAARKEYGDKAVLNFPGAGETGIEKTRLREEGRCIKGHDLAVHGYRHARGINCRICNAEARKRSYRRKTAKAEDPK